MLSADDVFTVMLMSVDNLLDTLYGNTDRVFYREVSVSDCVVARWMATIQIREMQLGALPITFHLQLGKTRSHLELSAIFNHHESNYRYTNGRWYQDGAPCPAELSERCHPLAVFAATTVDATTVSVQSLGRLQGILSDVLVIPAVDVIWAKR